MIRFRRVDEPNLLFGRETPDLTTPAGRAMAGLFAVFAEFEREILGERVCTGLAHAGLNGKRLGRPPSVVHKSRLHGHSTSAEPPSAASRSKGSPNLRNLGG